MRVLDRVPVILNWFMQNDEAFIEFTGQNVPSTIDRFHNNIVSITYVWTLAPELRFGQLLINMGIVPDGHWWHLEEDNWLIEKGYFNIEDIKFWGNNVGKDGKPLGYTQWKLLKDLELDHIKAIIKYMDERRRKLPEGYAAYFLKRIKEGK